jgi:hypothetical protein
MYSSLEELSKYYEENRKNLNSIKAIQARLDQFELDDIKNFVLTNLSNEHFDNSDNQIDYIRNIVDYAQGVSKIYENQRSNLLNSTYSFALYCVTYIVAILTLSKNTTILSKELVTTTWAALVILATCIVVWLVHILTLNFEYAHRTYGYSPYFFKYNVGKFFKPTLLNIFRKRNVDKISDKSYYLDLAIYHNEMKSITSNVNNIITSDLEQIMMLFRLTAHKSFSIDIMRKIMLTGFAIGMLMYILLFSLSITI